MPEFQSCIPAAVAGTEGYVEDAAWLIPRYESIDPAEKYRAVAHLFPESPGTILDVGAGTGVDAGWLARHGHRVVAVEPVAALRYAGARLHAAPGIAWVEDSFPTLSNVIPPENGFDAVIASAVWNHLDLAQREQAMSRLAALIGADRPLILSLRHGPSPANRRMFDVSHEETIGLAAAHGFTLAAHIRTTSLQAINRQAGVTWSWLAFDSAPASCAAGPAHLGA